MLKYIYGLFTFRRGFKSLKVQYLLMILAIKSELEYYQKNNHFTEYQLEEIQFHLSRLEDYYNRLNTMNFIQAGIIKHVDCKNYMDLFKKNLLKCNDIILLASQHELLSIRSNVDILINDKSHDLFNQLAPDLQDSFHEFLKLMDISAKAIDDKELDKFIEFKGKAARIEAKIVEKITQENYTKLLEKIKKYRKNPDLFNIDMGKEK